MYPQTMKIPGNLAAILCLFILSACSFLSSAPDMEQGEEELEEAAASETEGAADNSGVEIVWETPREPVDEFVIHYGYARENLDSQIKVPVAELETREDPQHGPVFRYVIGDLDAKRDVYVSLASVKAGEASPLSQVFEIRAQQ